MKIKLLSNVSRQETGMMVDLQQDEIINVDESVADKLVSAGKAEYEF